MMEEKAQHSVLTCTVALKFREPGSKDNTNTSVVRINNMMIKILAVTIFEAHSIVHCADTNQVKYFTN